jgi:hypothetical protein
VVVKKKYTCYPRLQHIHMLELLHYWTVLIANGKKFSKKLIVLFCFDVEGGSPFGSPFISK